MLPRKHTFPENFLGSLLQASFAHANLLHGTYFIATLSLYGNLFEGKDMTTFSENAGFELYDHIVVGLGGHGSATLAALAKANPGAKILGLERFNPAHGFGSSHGQSRIYRQAYFEHPAYVPLLQRSLELCKELDEHHIADGNDVHLLELCGGAMIGHPDSVVVSGTKRSIKEHNLPHEVFNQAQMHERYPGMNLSETEVAVREDAAGYLRPERWHIFQIIEITTESGTIFRTKKLALTMGAWAPSQPELSQVSLGLSHPLYVVRKVLFWFKLSKEAGELYKNIPIYIWDLGEGEGNFYGFPALKKSDREAKIPGAALSAHLTGDATLSDEEEEEEEEEEDYYELKVAFHVRYDYDASRDIVQEPLSVDRSLRGTDLGSLCRILEAHFPLLQEPEKNISHHAVCMYTMTHDEHFLIDFHPQYTKNVIVASPCSGHGYKFCSGIGEVISDMMTHGYTKHDISLFKLR